MVDIGRWTVASLASEAGKEAEAGAALREHVSSQPPVKDTRPGRETRPYGVLDFARSLRGWVEEDYTKKAGPSWAAYQRLRRLMTAGSKKAPAKSKAGTNTPNAMALKAAARAADLLRPRRGGKPAKASFPPNDPDRKVMVGHLGTLARSLGYHLVPGTAAHLEAIPDQGAPTTIPAIPALPTPPQEPTPAQAAAAAITPQEGQIQGMDPVVTQAAIAAWFAAMGVAPVAPTPPTAPARKKATKKVAA